MLSAAWEGFTTAGVSAEFFLRSFGIRLLVLVTKMLTKYIYIYSNIKE